MKHLTMILMAIAITTTTMAQIDVNFGMSNFTDKDFDPGISLGLQTQIVNLEIGQTLFYVGGDLQVSNQKAFGNDDDKYYSVDIGTGFYVSEKYFEAGLIGGLSSNYLPNAAGYGNDYVFLIDYQPALGYYFGGNLIFKYPFNDKFGVFIMHRSTMRIFTSDYEYSYYDVNNNMIIMSGSEKYQLYHQIFSVGVKIKF